MDSSGFLAWIFSKKGSTSSKLIWICMVQSSHVLALRSPGPVLYIAMVVWIVWEENKGKEKWDYGTQVWNKAVSSWLWGAKHLWQPNEKCKTKFLWNQVIFNALWVPAPGACCLPRISNHLLRSRALFVRRCPAEGARWRGPNKGHSRICRWASREGGLRGVVPVLCKQLCLHIMYPHQYVGRVLCFWMLNQQRGCVSISLNLPWL